MPLLSRVAVRLATVHLVVGFAAGSLLLAGVGGAFPARWLRPHVELVLVGFMAQFVMGIAYWILPRRPGRPDERGREPWAVVALAALNAGVAWVGLSSFAGAGVGLRAVGTALELAAGLSFTVHAWPRVRAAA